MPKRSTIETLPPELREELDRRLVAAGFSGYEELSAWLASEGHARGKSSVHRYGAKFEERCKTLQLVTQQARAIVAETPDDDNAVNEALIRLSQEKAFSVLMDMKLDPDTVELPKLIRAIADIGRSSVQQKKFQAQVNERARAAADEVASIARKGGMSDETAEVIKARILGIGG